MRGGENFNYTCTVDSLALTSSLAGPDRQCSLAPNKADSLALSSRHLGANQVDRQTLICPGLQVVLLVSAHVFEEGKDTGNG